MTTTSSSIFAGLGCLLVASIIYFRKLKANPARAHLPPGPKPIPVLGNVKDLRAKELWLPAMDWAKQYGDITYLHVFGQGLTFINSLESASDLLEKRGGMYADKPQFTMVCELCNCKNMVAFTPYGEQSKRQRRLMHKAFAPARIPDYHPLMESSTNLFLRNVIASPADYIGHVRRYSGSLTLNIVYGYEVTSNEDEYLMMAEECVGILANEIASAGGVWAVDVMPFLAKIPKWAEGLPGMSFKRKARKWKKMMEDWVDGPFEYVKNTMKSGSYKQSFCSSLLDDESISQTQEHFEFDLKWTANSMYAASIDTTITSVAHFLLAMMKHPEVLKKAQHEIDTVVGQDRLPTFSDRKSLPYVEAVLSETWRWASPVPLSLPHKLTEDDVYRGMYIPKGSLIFANIWAMTRDERIFPDPETFNPERYLNMDPETKKKQDPRNFIFGFGRRLCPGNHIVDASLWLLVVRMMATLDISTPVDEKGNAIDIVPVFDNPIFRTPNPFPCDMRPRSEKAVNLIRQYADPRASA
ncbi:cytochrome P450 [Coprinopsis cinerea okayama7|uniref:Cytochrome P450 n=1 Tax=Coprinopsis cinerea (strain Okayama-7 / 130 / ATCC MYA-4618 / FGSC 9003) TaxID=240176 RepID=A8NM71_COPC7|nr:cytochrome P450 [Coprinopsis cinerea okayama7\|eukprot:XP_001834855.2 cytochrome P450 [Coprinopsis cinerea okayama7\